jgi:hypothetical protein
MRRWKTMPRCRAHKMNSKSHSRHAQTWMANESRGVSVLGQKWGSYPIRTLLRPKILVPP